MPPAAEKAASGAASDISYTSSIRNRTRADEDFGWRTTEVSVSYKNKSKYL